MTGVAEDETEVSDDEQDRPVPLKPRPRALTVLALVAILVVVIDTVSKQLVVAHLQPGQPVRLLGGAIYLSLYRNSGAAFSMGTSHTWIFPTIAVIVIVAIGWLCRGLRSVGWAISLGLIAGGAIGNLDDRLFRAPGPMRGEVVDFISLFSSDGRDFAIFNLADSALTVGVVIAVALEIFGRHRDGTRATQEPRRGKLAADAPTDGESGDKAGDADG